LRKRPPRQASKLAPASARAPKKRARTTG
jgi:hypothetical protein